MIELLSELGNELGLAAVGVAPPLGQVKRVYGWAESVVVGAISYLQESEALSGPDRGLVARVARSADYHIVMREKLTKLAGALGPGARVEVCVDTCALSERTLALEAGIGWRGKNGCVFVEGCGSYVALGEIVTDVKLGTSKPSKIERCGACDECIRACPTGALAASCALKQDVCLSNVTQAGGEIPSRIRRILGNRIYGCDVCQEVCPQNANITPTGADFAVEMFPGAHPLILPLLSLSSGEFELGVRQSSIGWIGRNRIRRNAAVAAGNLKYEESAPALGEMLRDPSPVIRSCAAWALDVMRR